MFPEFDFMTPLVIVIVLAVTVGALIGKYVF